MVVSYCFVFAVAAAAVALAAPEQCTAVSIPDLRLPTFHHPFRQRPWVSSEAVFLLIMTCAAYHFLSFSARDEESPALSFLLPALSYAPLSLPPSTYRHFAAESAAVSVAAGLEAAVPLEFG